MASNVEIERKFLVVGQAYKAMAQQAVAICQGYICREQGRTVRVRLWGDKAFLTIKGPSADGGLSRYEFESEIPVADARHMLRLCLPGIIDKTRWMVPVGSHVFEVDEFHGDNQGLVVAEVELSSADEAFERPPFLGREVTGDRRYYNSCLTKCPFSAWGDGERQAALCPGPC